MDHFDIFIDFKILDLRRFILFKKYDDKEVTKNKSVELLLGNHNIRIIMMLI